MLLNGNVIRRLLLIVRLELGIRAELQQAPNDR
jgi:hypothetical protein